MPPINSYQYGAYNELGSGNQMPDIGSAVVRMPQLIVTADKPKKSKGKSQSKAKAQKSEPLSVSYDGGKTWMQQGGPNQPEQGPLVSADGGNTWIPQNQQVAVSPGYDTNRGIEIMDALTQLYPGMNPDVAAGVAGNLLYESYGLPNIYEGQNPSNAGSYTPETGGYGLAQWTGPRRSALMAMPNPETLATQMQYLAQENAGPERSAWEATMAAPTLQDAARVFATQWERPGVPALNRRIDLATQLRNAYDMRNADEMQRQAQILAQPMQIAPLPIEQNLDYNLMLPRR